ncbi:ATP-binding protein [Streptomyces sp. NBC_00557]|uniref:ATP-binding protein n=1 Tax=Streptomyces sp. NBC_00557 TaxID=2975776 RepID=UPI002E804B2A|nr:ATP-binding protein [Streptomyces sp. NBC_00557]WUC39728.1 ATP-binding protein [Streptomyces sp. NBC_00557]
MDPAGHDEGRRPLVEGLAEGPISVSAAFEGSEEIAKARHLARLFLTDVQAVHGLPVSSRAMGMVQLVVSELVTNARKYAPGLCLLTLTIEEGAVQVSVWDSGTAVPAVLAPDPSRIGQHGLEIVMAVCQSFAVHREPVGKRITATVALADDPGADASATSRYDQVPLWTGSPSNSAEGQRRSSRCERPRLGTAGMRPAS